MYRNMWDVKLSNDVNEIGIELIEWLCWSEIVFYAFCSVLRRFLNN